METLYDCAVVANGSFPQTAGPLELLKATPVIIACDGAVQNLHERGLVPSAIVGDLDSIPSEMLRLYADRIHTVEDQEINDLTKAVRFAHASGYRKILILGATGLREDHTLGNISLLTDFAPLFEVVEMLSDYGRFIPVLRTTTLPCTPGQQISIFSMAHHPTAPDILVARLPQRSPGNRVYPHLIPRCPINHLFPVPRIIFNLQFSIKKKCPGRITTHFRGLNTPSILQLSILNRSLTASPFMLVIYSADKPSIRGSHRSDRSTEIRACRQPLVSK